MKKLFLGLLIMFICVAFAEAKSLKWDASTGDVDGYKVYYTDGEGPWTNIETDQEAGVGYWSTDVGDSISVDLAKLNLTPGTYYFHVKAYNAMGESEQSNIAEYSMAGFIPTDNPKPITIIIAGPVTVRIE